jgi:hypothetical protein
MNQVTNVWNNRTQDFSSPHSILPDELKEEIVQVHVPLDPVGD